MKPILTLGLLLAATLSMKSAPADKTAAVNPTQSKPMAGMTEMMSPQPGFRLYGWIETGTTWKITDKLTSIIDINFIYEDS